MVKQAWIQQAQSRGLTGVVDMLLDIVEPISPIAAQIFWIAQPAAHIFGAGDMIRQLAEALEEPDGVALLRSQLHDTDHDADAT